MAFTLLKKWMSFKVSRTLSFTDAMILYGHGMKIRPANFYHLTSHSGIRRKPSGGTFDWKIHFGGLIEP